MSTKEERTARAIEVDAGLDELTEVIMLDMLAGDMDAARAQERERAVLCIELASLVREGIDLDAVGIDESNAAFILASWPASRTYESWAAEFDSMAKGSK